LTESFWQNHWGVGLFLPQRADHEGLLGRYLWDGFAGLVDVGFGLQASESVSHGIGRPFKKHLKKHLVSATLL
jgi:hypothetical protein